MPLRVKVEDYRCLRAASWTLEPGISLLVGPNGSGKTTLLGVPAFLRNVLAWGAGKAVDEHGGPGTIVRFGEGAVETARVVADAGPSVWELVFRPRGGAVEVSERILSAGKQARSVKTDRSVSLASLARGLALPSQRSSDVRALVHSKGWKSRLARE